MQSGYPINHNRFFISCHNRKLIQKRFFSAHIWSNIKNGIVLPNLHTRNTHLKNRKTFSLQGKHPLGTHILWLNIPCFPNPQHHSFAGSYARRNIRLNRKSPLCANRNTQRRKEYHCCFCIRIQRNIVAQRNSIFIEKLNIFNVLVRAQARMRYRQRNDPCLSLESSHREFCKYASSTACDRAAHGSIWSQRNQYARSWRDRGGS